MSYFIYAHITPNGKIYIGQTNDIKRRWQPSQYRQCVYFEKAIQKYGWDNIQHIILQQNLQTRQEANELEKYYIKKYNTTNPQKGYNLTSGGDSNYIRTKESLIKNKQSMLQKWQDQNFKEKVRKASNKKLVQCLNTGNIYYSCEKAAKQVGLSQGSGIRRCCLGERQYAGKDPETNIKLSWIYIENIENALLEEERLQKIIEIRNKSYQIGRQANIKGGWAKKVQCIETGDIFETITDAAKWANITSIGNISQVCKGKRKHAGQHPQTKQSLSWRYIQTDKI